MYLHMGQFITRPKVVDIPITDVVINAVEKMVEDHGFKSLKIYNKKERNYFPGVDLAGVDHQQQIEKSKKTKMRNINMKTTTHKVFIMGILIRKYWVGY